MSKPTERIPIRPCPFCGCSMEARLVEYPCELHGWEYDGWHDDRCPLANVLWSWQVVEEGGWTGEQVAENWNRRCDRCEY